MTERILLNIHDQSVFTDILDIAGEAIISVDANYRILLFNKKAQQIFGYAADEIIGQSLDLLLPQRFHAAHHEHITKFTQSDIPSRLMGERQEIFGLRRNGQEFPAEASISKLGIDGQHVFIVIIGDITRRKQMEQELQKHHKQLESLVEDRTIKLTTSLAETKHFIERLQQEIIEREQIEEQLQASYEYLDTILLNLPAGVAILEGPDFRYFRINRTLAKLNGLPVEEHLGKTLIEVLPDAEQRILPEMRQIMDTGKPILDREFTMSLPSDPDTPVNLVDYLFPILGTDRKIRAIGAVVINITERKQAEQALRKSEEKYRDLVEKVSDVIYTVDAGGVITYLNPAIESLIGLPPEQVVGKSFAQFILPEDFDQAEDNFKELLSGVAPGSNEYRVLTATGETRWIRATSQPIMNEGQVTGAQGVLTDITERKMVDEKIEETATAVERQRLARELHDSVTQILYSIDLFSNATQQALSSGRIDTAKEHSSQIRSLSQSALADMRLLIFELQPPKRFFTEGMTPVPKRIHIKYQEPGLWADRLKIETYPTDVQPKETTNTILVERKTDSKGIMQAIYHWGLVDLKTDKEHSLPPELHNSLSSLVGKARD